MLLIFSIHTYYPISDKKEKWFSNYELYYILIFIYQIKHLTKIVNEFEELFNISTNIRNSLNLVKLLGTIFTILHLFACLWLNIGISEINAKNESWMEKIEI